VRPCVDFEFVGTMSSVSITLVIGDTQFGMLYSIFEGRVLKWCQRIEFAEYYRPDGVLHKNAKERF
jgi:hypothetical protein